MVNDAEEKQICISKVSYFISTCGSFSPMEFRPSAKIGCPISGRLGDFCLPNGEIGLENCIFGVSSWPEWQGWLIMSYGSVKIIGMGGVGKIIIAHFGRKVVGVVMHCGCGIECIEHSKSNS